MGDISIQHDFPEISSGQIGLRLDIFRTVRRSVKRTEITAWETRTDNHALSLECQDHQTSWSSTHPVFTSVSPPNGMTLG